MWFHLLFPTLVTGIVAFQTGNMNGSSSEELRQYVESLRDHVLNSTNTTNVNDTVKPGDVTATRLPGLDFELGLPSQSKLNLTTEDEESFQEHEDQYDDTQCQEDVLEAASHSLCGTDFQKSMEAIGVQNWCSIDDIIRPYNNLTLCVEFLSKILHCHYPNPSVQSFFLHTHARYFQTCSEEEMDAPYSTMVVLTLVPVSLIPVLVYLVMLKNNGRE